MIERAGVMLHVEYLRLNKVSNKLGPTMEGLDFWSPGQSPFLCAHRREGAMSPRRARCSLSAVTRPLVPFGDDDRS